DQARRHPRLRDRVRRRLGGRGAGGLVASERRRTRA
ncbi:MAG: hypothetical protein AVDCRST_MAG64-871, partial [uncultured Phycisphaerae bacterium]